MTAVRTDQRPDAPVRPIQGRSAWREEMLGELLKKMRDHQTAEEAPPPARPAKGLAKGRYVDVYV